ncbi:MAG: hypothetical protein ACI3XR_07570 [Eubacteriales bacterium]
MTRNEFTRGLKDILIPFVYEALWIVLIIEVSGVLSLYWLEPLFGGFILFLPASIFALGLLALLWILHPKWVAMAVAFITSILIFPFLEKTFSDGFYAWEMVENGGWEKVVRLAFWAVSFVAQGLVLLIRALWLKRKLDPSNIHNID